jgi:glycosyltransferase involved in cell wall biosynthesis
MRILYLHQYFKLPSDPGGTRSFEMARRLVAAGHRVFMLTSDPRGRSAGPGWRVTHEAGIEVHWLPVAYSNRMSYLKRMQAFVRFAVGASFRAAAIPADVVFATSTPLTIALPGVYAARKQKIPLVFEVRDLWPELPIAVGALKGVMIPPALWLEKFAYRHAERVVALSPGMRDGVARSGFPAARIHVIPNSADLDLFGVPEEAGRGFRDSRAWLQDRPLVLYTGTLGRINGVGYLAELAAETRKINPEIRFLVVGEGAEEELVRRRARELGVYERNFFMMQPLPKKEMPALLSAASVAVSLFIDLPEMWANSANKFFDALASGTPVAINYRGWQAELLEKHGAGIVLPAGNIPGAAAELTDLLAASRRLQNAALAARRLAETRFDRNRLAQQLEALLREVVQARTGPA